MRKVMAGVCLLLVSACGTQTEPSTLSEPSHFFQQSTRRDATPEEAARIGELGGCAMFFVENRDNRFLMMSARHCVNYQIESWCQGTNFIRLLNGRNGRCKRVIAADSRHDLALFEADFGDYVHEGERFKLSARAPAVGTRLQMIGYPGDRYRNGRMTVTENCWVLLSDAPSPHGSGSRLGDRSARHNCTTYGGNSGGPMYIKGTNTVVGLPFTYRPNDYTQYPPNSIYTSAFLAKTQDFVATFRSKLNAAGVVIVE